MGFFPDWPDWIFFQIPDWGSQTGTRLLTATQACVAPSPEPPIGIFSRIRGDNPGVLKRLPPWAKKQKIWVTRKIWGENLGHGTDAGTFFLSTQKEFMPILLNFYSNLINEKLVFPGSSRTVQNFTLRGFPIWGYGRVWDYEKLIFLSLRERSKILRSEVSLSWATAVWDYEKLVFLAPRERSKILRSEDSLFGATAVSGIMKN